MRSLDRGACGKSASAGTQFAGPFGVRAVTLAAAFVLAAFLVWRLAGLLLLAFGAALLATLLRVIAGFIGRRAHLPDKVAYACALLLVAVLVGGAVWLLGAQTSAQLSALVERLPGALDRFQAWLEEQSWLSPLVAEARGSGAAIAKRVGAIALIGVDAAIGALLVLFGAIYFGAEPGLYRRGIVALFPPAQRARVARALELGAYAMRRWLLSQLLDMAAVGTLTGVGLWLAGVPAALALGLITALAAFVPYVGAFVAGALAVLVAFGESARLALWALGIYLAVQQVENHLILPFVQRWAVSAPPALALFAVVGMGYLLGPLGVLFAAPLTVVGYVLARELYVREETAHGRSGASGASRN